MKKKLNLLLIYMKTVYYNSTLSPSFRYIYNYNTHTYTCVGLLSPEKCTHYNFQLLKWPLICYKNIKFKHPFLNKYIKIGNDYLIYIQVM